MSASPPAPHRALQLEQLFRTCHERLEATVSRRIRSDHTVIQDACATAWATLTRRTDIDLSDPRTIGWLHTVALHEAYALTRDAQRTDLDPSRHATDADCLVDVVAARMDDLAHLKQLASLKPAECEAILLKEAGYSYAEIGQLTGASYTAVNRRLAEGRAALRDMAR